MTSIGLDLARLALLTPAELVLDARFPALSLFRAPCGALALRL